MSFETDLSHPDGSPLSHDEIDDARDAGEIFLCGDCGEVSFDTAWCPRCHVGVCDRCRVPVALAEIGDRCAGDPALMYCKACVVDVPSGWPVDCPTCGRAPTTDYGYGVTLSCGNCYDADCSGDPPEFHSTSPLGAGMTLDEAIADWNASVESRADDAPPASPVSSSSGGASPGPIGSTDDPQPRTIENHDGKGGCVDGSTADRSNGRQGDGS